MKRFPHRLNLVTSCAKLRTDDKWQGFGVADDRQRFIRLTELIPPICRWWTGKIASHLRWNCPLKKDEQENLFATMESEKQRLTLTGTADEKHEPGGQFDMDMIFSI